MRYAFVAALAALSFSGAAQAQIDSRQPVEINADQLEVQQQENVAVFTGSVIAVQGDTRLKSDRMVVHYRPKEGNDTAAQSTVELIEVEGSVLLVTPEESAAGDRGVYEVDKREVRLFSNVVLTRGDNILKGDSLVYDFATSRSVINSPLHTPADAVKPGGGRVRALFVPGKKE